MKSLFRSHTILGMVFLGILSVCVSCKENVEKDSILTISEVMVDNRTGLLSDDGEHHGWLEINNESASPVNLKDYALARDSGAVQYELPDVMIQPDECVVLYDTKKPLKDSLCCDISLRAGGDTIQIVTARGTVISEVAYKKLKADQALKRTSKGEYKKTYSSTPGFANDDQGRIQYLALLDSQCKSPVRIWEFMSKNTNSMMSDVKTHSWVEIKNTSNETIDLAGYTLRSDTAKLAMPRATIAPGAIVLVNDDAKALSGESVILEKDGKYVDGICAGDTYYGVSMGRSSDKPGWFYFGTPTPGTENGSTPYTGITEKPKFVTKGGIYKEDSVYVDIKTYGCTVHYTTDGSIPTTASPVYKDKFLITQNTVVRAFATDSANLRSKMVTATYLVKEKHTLPVFSITMDESDLYDNDKGIYVKGPGASSEFPYQGANFWKRWEKCAHIEFFDGKDGFSYDCGIKIFGAYSRAREKKSFHIKFRRRYGEANLEYDLYNRGKKDKVSSFVLRSGSQDDTGTMVRDEFFTSLMAEGSPTLHVQAYRPVVVYLNGKYFGVYYIREKINDEFVANHLNVKKESATMLVAQGNAEVGSNAEYRALEEYARTHNMRDAEAYKYMNSQIDFQSLIDYKIGEFYSGNCDVGNIRYFKSSDKNCNQKWHWLYYDLDWGFYYYTPLRFYINAAQHRASGGSLAPYNLFVDKLLDNPEFRKMFLERWSYHRTHTFSKAHATEVFNGIIKTIEPEMKRNCERWPQMGYQSWQRNVENFRVKIAERLPKLEEIVLSDLAVTPQEKAQYFK